ncbi:MAG: alpha/beta hydrolase [Alphaproteobacteria bacterium]|nr:alpha/beta hydrolase [Alphaproteobacteria bacterium]
MSISFTRRALTGGLGAAALAGCSPTQMLNALVPDDTYEREAGLSYGEGPRRRLDVYRPRDGSSSARPLVVFFYGGSWRNGARGNYAFVGEALAAMGAVAVLPDYRVFPEARHPDFVEDGAAAVRWAAANAGRYGADPARLIVMGHSAGAHIAALLTLDRAFGVADAISGFVGLAGPYAFDPLEYRSTRDVFAHLPDPGVVRPVRYARADAPPMLLLHGDDDTTVGPYNSADLAAALAGTGASHRLVVLPGTGHIGIVLGLSAPFRDRAITEAVAGFIRSGQL